MTKVITKRELIRSNKLALKANGRGLNTDFLKSLREDLFHLLERASEFEESPDFVRCWVGIGASILEYDFVKFLMDIPTAVFESLTTTDELLDRAEKFVPVGSED